MRKICCKYNYIQIKNVVKPFLTLFLCVIGEYQLKNDHQPLDLIIRMRQHCLYSHGVISFTSPVCKRSTNWASSIRSTTRNSERPADTRTTGSSATTSVQVA